MLLVGDMFNPMHKGVRGNNKNRTRLLTEELIVPFVYYKMSCDPVV